MQATGDIPNLELIVAATATVLVVAATGRSRGSLATQLIATVAIVGLTALLAGLAVRVTEYTLERPGRSAREHAQEWESIVDDRFDEHVEIPQEEEGPNYGAGFGRAGDGLLLLHGESETSHAVPWVLYPDIDPGSDFYTEVRARLRPGPVDAGCGLMFAWQGRESWWGIRITGSNSVQITRYEGIRDGRLDSRSFFGPVTLEHADIGDGVRLGVQRLDDQFSFFVNDRRLVSLDATTLLTPSGSVAPYAVDTETSYRAVYECEFEHLQVRAAAEPG